MSNPSKSAPNAAPANRGSGNRSGAVVVGLDDTPLEGQLAGLNFTAAEANDATPMSSWCTACVPLATATAPAPGLSLDQRRERGESIAAAAAAHLAGLLAPTVRSAAPSPRRPVSSPWWRFPPPPSKPPSLRHHFGHSP